MKISKKTLSVGLASLALVSLAACGQNTSPAVNAESKSDDPRVLVVGADPTFRPISFEDDSGEITGFDLDFASALASEIGYELDYQAVAWDGIIPSLESGSIDAITNMVVTEERKQKVAFSEPYMQQTIMAVVRKDDPSSFSTLKDLSALRVGVMGGTGSANQVEAAGLAGVKQYNTAQDLYQDLSLSRLDVAVIESFSGSYAVKENFSDKLKVANSDIGESRTVQAVALRKTDQELLEQINTGIESLLRDGTLDELVEKWFGELDYEIQ